MTNNIKTMNIIKFLEEREIQYIYIQLDYTKTEPFITKPNVSKDNMFYYDNGKNMNNSPNKIFNHPNKEKLIEENHRLYKNNNAIAIDTQNIIWGDMDIKDNPHLEEQTEDFKKFYHKIKKDLPYHKSNTKEFGFHNILCSKNELNELYKGIFQNFTGGEISDINCKGEFTKINKEYKFLELMTGKPLWCLKDRVMENCNKKNLIVKSNNILVNVLNKKFKDKYKNKTDEEIKKEEKEKEKKKKKEVQKKQLEEVKIDNN